MLKVNPNPVFKADVDLSIPGGVEKVTFTFRHKDKESFKEFVDRAAQGKSSELEIAKEIIADWEGVDAKFSDTALEGVLKNYHAAGEEIFTAYTRELTKARLGN